MPGLLASPTWNRDQQEEGRLSPHLAHRWALMELGKVLLNQVHHPLQKDKLSLRVLPAGGLGLGAYGPCRGQFFPS